MRLKERVTERAFQWNGITSDPRWWNMRHERIRGRCLNLAAREDTERGRGNILCKEREFVAKLQGFQNSNFYDFKILFPSNEVFTLHYKSVLLYLLFLLGGHLTFDSLGAHSKKFACSAGGLALIPGLGKSPGEGNGNPLQYSCQENFMDREAWWATVHGVPKSHTRLSN